MFFELFFGAGWKIQKSWTEKNKKQMASNAIHIV